LEGIGHPSPRSVIKLGKKFDFTPRSSIFSQLTQDVDEDATQATVKPATDPYQPEVVDVDEFADFDTVQDNMEEQSVKSSYDSVQMHNLVMKLLQELTEYSNVAKTRFM
jgi:hypothetical protein